MVVSRRCIKTNTISQLEPLQEVVIYLELAIETLTFVLIQVSIQNIIRVHHAIRCVIITWRVERIVQILKFRDCDITRCLHDSVIHILKTLTSLHEVVFLICIVQRRTESQIINLVRTTGRESILLIFISTSRNDTVIGNLRERHEIVALVRSTVKRQTVRIAETGIEEVLHIILDSLVGLNLLRVVVHSTILQCRVIELWTP